MKTRKCIRSLFRFVPLSLLLIVALSFGSQVCHAFQNQGGNDEPILLAASTVAVQGSVQVTRGPAVKASKSWRSALSDADGDGLSDGLQARLADMRPDDSVDVVVTFREKGSVAALQKSVGPFRVKREFKIIPAFAATIKAAQARGLAKAAGVFRVEEDFKVSTMLDAANVDFGTAAARTDFAVSGSGIGICVVDTGVDPNHEQLFDEQNNRSRVVDFVDYVNNRTEPYDDHFHGTHVAAIAAGDGTGGADAAIFQGVAPGAVIYAAKVLDSLGQGTESAVIEGVEWCAASARGGVGPGVHILSLSLGSTGSSDGQDALSQAVDNAVAAGKITIIAAGNSGDGESTVGSPGAAEQALTVGAAAEWSAAASAANHSRGVYLAPFSSRGPTADGRIKPDIVAPGVSITAADANTGNGYATYSGTSMATPFISGAVALALESNPDPTPANVKSMLMSTAQDRGPAGPDNDWGSGLLDGYAFIASAQKSSGENTFPEYQRTTGSVPNNGQELFTFEVTEDGLGVPAAVTLTITDGTAVCLYGSPLICDLLGGWTWSPDLDAELIRPDGSVIASSICPLTGECGSMGRQETLHYLPKDPQRDIGTYTVRVYPFADDPDGAMGGSVALDISTGPLPAVSANTPPTATDDSYGMERDAALVVAAPGVLGNDSDADGYSLTTILASAPTDGALVLDPDGAFTYTPAQGYSGTDSFFYRAHDGVDESNLATVSITVAAVNDPPVADDQGVTTEEDTALAITLTASDADGDPLTYAVVNGPANGSLSGTAPAVTYTPAPYFNGSDSFTFRANDGKADSNMATVSITVAAVNDPPVADDQGVTTEEDTALAITLTASDADDDPLTYAVVNGPANGSLSGIAPAVTYTPTLGYNGSDSFTFRANDRTADSNLATVSITVTPASNPPQSDVIIIGPAEYKDKAKQLLAEATSSAQPTAVLTLSFDDGSPQGYSAVMPYSAADAKYVYRDKAPKPLDEQVTVTSDLGGTHTKTLDGTDVVNNPPQANDDSFTAPANSNGNLLDVLNNDSDPDGDALSITSVSNPANQGGTVISNSTSDGVLYTPVPDFAGQETFTYTVTDGSGGTDSATVTVTVGSGGNAAPTALPDYETTTKNSPVVIDLVSNDSDSDGTIDPTTIVIELGPIRGATVEILQGGEVNYTPKKNFVGTDTFTYTVKDNEGASSNEATVSVIVNR